MSAVYIDDEFLYAHMPQAERLMLERIPPERELNHHFSRRFLRKMRALLRYERRTPRMRKAVHRMKVAAAVFAVIVSLTFGALMSVEASRTRIIEIVTKLLSDATSVRVSVDDGAPSDRVLRPVMPTYVPEGYHVVDEETDVLTHMIIYEDESGRAIDYTQDMPFAAEYVLDTEDVYTEKVLIGSQEVWIVVKPSRDYCTLYWFDNHYFYWVSGNKIESDELLKMAESVIIQRNMKIK